MWLPVNVLGCAALGSCSGVFRLVYLAQVGRVGTALDGRRRLAPCRPALVTTRSRKLRARKREMDGSIRVHSEVKGSGFHRVARESPVSRRQHSDARRRSGCFGALAGKKDDRKEVGGRLGASPSRRRQGRSVQAVGPKRGLVQQLLL